MTRHNAEAHPARFPARARPDRAAVEHTLAVLTNWRIGSIATAIVMASLLPFAIAWHLTYVTGLSAAVALAAILACVCHVRLHCSLTSLSVHSEFADLPQLAQRHGRLTSSRSRRALAHGLRRTVAPNQPPARFDCCPILRDRVAAVRPELLDIAAVLEQADDPDPVSVALIHELLHDGCSPLYDDRVAPADLEATLRRARVGLTAHQAS